jgi:hypothetical protein
MNFNSATERLLESLIAERIEYLVLRDQHVMADCLRAVQALLAHSACDPWQWPKPVRDALAADRNADILVSPLCTALHAIAEGEKVSRETLASLRNRLKW